MAGGQDPSIADDRAAAEADLVVHRAIEPDLPGIFAIRGSGSPNDHLGIRLAQRLTVHAAGQAGKQ